MATVGKTTDATFQSDVLGAKGLVVVDFWAEWCGPCRMIGPALDAIAAKMGDKVKIVKMNVDENPNMAGKLGIQSIPALFMYKNGELVDRKVGAAPQSALESWINAKL